MDKKLLISTVDEKFHILIPIMCREKGKQHETYGVVFIHFFFYKIRQKQKISQIKLNFIAGEWTFCHTHTPALGNMVKQWYVHKLNWLSWKRERKKLGPLPTCTHFYDKVKNVAIATSSLEPPLSNSLAVLSLLTSLATSNFWCKMCWYIRRQFSRPSLPGINGR